MLLSSHNLKCHRERLCGGGDKYDKYLLQGKWEHIIPYTGLYGREHKFHLQLISYKTEFYDRFSSYSEKIYLFYFWLHYKLSFNCNISSMWPSLTLVLRIAYATAACWPTPVLGHALCLPTGSPDGKKSQRVLKSRNVERDAGHQLASTGRASEHPLEPFHSQCGKKQNRPLHHRAHAFLSMTIKGHQESLSQLPTVEDTVCRVVVVV